MDRTFLVANLEEALALRQFPTTVVWNRIEGRPRREDFSRALRAEVRDALWMLTKQWQMGEFRGDDAGSPALAKVGVGTTQITKYRAKAHAAQAYDRDAPLEAVVERRPLPISEGGRHLMLDIRLLMGRRWIRMVGTVADYAQAFIDRYPIRRPDPGRKEDAELCAHPEVWAAYAAVAGRAMDGAALYLHLKAGPSAHPYDGIAAVLDDHKPKIDALAGKFIAWFGRLFDQPTKTDAWEASRLEYRFSCAAPEQGGEKVLTADEYFHGHLDWYNVDLDRRSLGPEPVEAPAAADARAKPTFTILPTQVMFDGMPNTRWWAFEDGRTNLAAIRPDTTDLAKLLLIEFALVYANDWFLIPFTVPVGTVAKIEAMIVTNVFGERIWIGPAGDSADGPSNHWSMFTLTARDVEDKAANAGLLLLPTSPQILEGPPIEEVMLVRDEMANMVWGIERMIPLASGASKPAREAARETYDYFKGLIAQNAAPDSGARPLIENEARIRYELMNTVPENWIPFIPVHVKNSNRETQLQRAAMVRIIEGDPQPQKVRPRTSLLREGLDRRRLDPYYVHEEKVLRAGVVVTQSFRRSRWYGGRVRTWLGVRKRTGRGEGSSGLAFDLIVPKVTKE